MEWYRQHIYRFRAETEYEDARSTPLFKKQVVDKLDPNEYPHIHDQMRNHMITSKYLLKLFFKKYIITNYNIKIKIKIIKLRLKPKLDIVAHCQVKTLSSRC